MAKIYPSLMGADLLNLEQVIKMLEYDADGFHVDIMDNQFVPNITWGVDTINAMARVSSRPLWIHLMVINPIDWIENLFLSGGTLITFHLESEKEILRLIKTIKGKKCRPSVAINPETPINQIFPLLDVIDHVLLMSVNPGFSGQPFLKSTLEKIDTLVEYRNTSGNRFEIGIDGGVTTDTIVDLVTRGVDDIAVCSAIFSTKNPVEALKNLKKMAS